MRCLILFAISISIAFSADFTTYIGGANGQYATAAIATDAAGNTYATGSNAFLAKVDPSGNIVFRSTFGPTNQYGVSTQANSIAIDPADNIWIAGQTTGQLALLHPIQSSPVANGVGFLMEIAPDQTVLYSSYFGGTLGNSAIFGMATDQDGNVYLTGFTNASDFKTTQGLPASPVSGGSLPIYGAFVAKLDPTGQKILYSTVIAGASGCASVEFCPDNASKTDGLGIAVDPAGEVLVAGTTNSTGLPDTPKGSGPGAFVFKITAAGNQIVYFDYLGAVANSVIFGARPIATDSAGSAYLTGYLPQEFAMKFDGVGTLAWTALLGNAPPTAKNAAIAVDSSNDVWVVGTASIGSAPPQNSISEVSADGSRTLASLPLGSPGQDIAIDPGGVLHVASAPNLISTFSPPNYLSPRPLSIVNAASGESSGTIVPGEIISIYGSGLGPTAGITASPESNLFPSSLGGVQVLVNGHPIPLLYVSASQINAEPSSPLDLLAGNTADVRVIYNSTPLPDFRVDAADSDFGTFQNEGSTAVINQDSTLNKITNPAKPGTVVSIWATGLGPAGQAYTGAVTTSASNYCSDCEVALDNGISRSIETVEYAGTSPGLIDGVMQINFLLPAQLSYASGGVFVYFTPPGASQPLNIAWVNVSR